MRQLLKLGIVLALVIAFPAWRAVARQEGGAPARASATAQPAPPATRSAPTADAARAGRMPRDAAVDARAPRTDDGGDATGPDADGRDIDGREGFASRRRLAEHFAKHGAEFPGLTMPQYLAAAQALRDAPTSDAVLELERADGVITRYDRRDGSFIAFARDGTIRTFFRPNDGERYFRRQARRAAGGGA
ncbi:MAG: hypothetical protein MUF21_10295 [Gemmatimonadaceae bacterium]|jgi:pyocin large subunit-like protein|nr:hypothetical protein [Gemmatimonadaceae bacterium]MCU0626854.1 hypothetical protein [Gemmatimonadaceae bacterium]